tara:strand:- start:471 stop:632 length:162 start_codon:yes stop_codon:yes gene_type:complete
MFFSPKIFLRGTFASIESPSLALLNDLGQMNFLFQKIKATDFHMVSVSLSKSN